MGVIKQDPAFAAPLRALSEHIRQALAGWFSPGLMQLRRITWDSSSGDMLERIIKVCLSICWLWREHGRDLLASNTWEGSACIQHIIIFTLL